MTSANSASTHEPDPISFGYETLPRIIATVFVAWILWWGFELRWVASAATTLPVSSPTALWVTPTEVVTVAEGAPSLVVAQWRLDDPRIPIVRARQFQPNSSVPPYALSRDTSKVAWWEDGTLHVGTFDAQGPQHAAPRAIKTDWSSTVEQVAFFTDDIVALRDTNHSVHFVSYTKPDSWLTTFGPFPKAVLYPCSRGLLVGSLASGFVGRFEMSSKEALSSGVSPKETVSSTEWQLGIWHGNALTIDGADLVVGCRDGVLGRYHPKNASLRDFQRLAGPIRALASPKEGPTLAGGDFPGLWVVDESGPPYLLLDTPPGARLLDASNSHFAMATDELTVVGKIDKKWQFKSWLTPPFFVTLVLGMAGLWLTLLGHYGRRKKRAPVAPSIQTQLEAKTRDPDVSSDASPTP